MCEILKSGRKTYLHMSPGNAISYPDNQIPCVVVHPGGGNSCRIHDILDPLCESLSQRGFRVHLLSEDSTEGSNFENLARDCALGVVVLSGSSPGLQYTYGYLKGRGKFVLTIRDVGSSNGSGDTGLHAGDGGNNAPGASGKSPYSTPSAPRQDRFANGGGLNEIEVDSSANVSSPGHPGNKIEEEIEAFVPAVVESYISEITKTYSSLDPEQYSRLRELALEVSHYYTGITDYGPDDLDKAYKTLIDWEKGAARRAPSQILSFLASLYMDSIHKDEGQGHRKKEFYDKAALIYQGTSVNEPDPLLAASAQKRLGHVLLGLSHEDDPSENIEGALKLFEEALKFFTSDAYPRDYAALQNSLGAAYGLADTSEDGSAALNKSIESYNEALKFSGKDCYPFDHSITNLNLGASYLKLAYNNNDRRENCLKAVSHFNEALKVCTIEKYPEEFGSTHMKLSGLYLFVAEGEDGIDGYNLAIGSCREALRVFTEEKFPARHRGRYRMI